MTIKECNTFKGIPYADYFSVNVEWYVASNQHSSYTEDINIRIILNIQFHKSTWLQGTIESNTAAGSLSNKFFLNNL
jgi:hypothetical protein